MGPVKFAERDWTHAQKLASSMGKPHNFTGGVDYPALSFFFLPSFLLPLGWPKHIAGFRLRPARGVVPPLGHINRKKKRHHMLWFVA